MKFGILAVILGLLGTASAAEPAAPDDGLPRPAFGAAIIGRLRDIKTRHQAVTELHLATCGVIRSEDRRDLPNYLRDPRLTRCLSPQGVLWMVSFVWDWESMHRRSAGFEERPDPAAYPLLPDDPANPANAALRFPAASGEGEQDGLWSPPAGSLADRILIFLTENGDVVWPFGGANMTHQGWIADLTGDGVLERAESTSWGHPVDRKARVEITSLRISTIEPTPHRLLTVLYNWHSREADKDSQWDWELRDTDGDGRLEACLGPGLVGGGIDAQAVYRWNPATQSYDGPEGGIGQHFLRQPDPSADDWEWLKQVAAKGGLGYPLHQSPPEIGKKPVVPPLPPFVPGSLAGLSDEELASFFLGRGEDSIESYEAKCEIPSEFWKLPPREAALRLADANRTKAHREKFALVTLPEAKTAPGTGTVQLQILRSWGQGETSEWLLIYEDRASLICPQSRQGPIKEREFPLERARWMLQTLWWLDQVRTKQREDFHAEENEFRSASDVAEFALSITPGDGLPAVVHPKAVLQGPLGSRWRGHYSRTIAFRLAISLWAAWLRREVWPVEPEPTPQQVGALLLPEKKLDGLIKQERWDEAIAYHATLSESERIRLVIRLCEALPAGHPEPATAMFEAWLPELRNEFSGVPGRLNEVEAALVHLANVHGGALPRRLEDVLRLRFASSAGRWDSTTLIAWSADLRGLEPELLRTATHDEEEEEDSRVQAMRVGAAKPMGRHHAARWVVALWNETDPLTRAKSLVCLAALHEMRADLPGLLGPRWRIEQEFRDAIGKLDATQRDALARFAKALPSMNLPGEQPEEGELQRVRDWALDSMKLGDL